MRISIIILVSIALFCSTRIMAQKRTITATVVNTTSDEGKIGFALYDKASFMKQPIQAKNSSINNGKSIVVFENIPVGEYAVICFHDKNNNEKMDFTPRGMPNEDYGTSNNSITYGPPQFSDAKFEVKDKDVSVEIRF